MSADSIPVGSTKDRLADDLEAANAPTDMVIRARGGYYDDYESPLATPCIQLVKDCHRHGLYRIAREAVAGKYDATPEESERWAEKAYKDPEMRVLMDKMGLGPKGKRNADAP